MAAKKSAAKKAAKPAAPKKAKYNPVTNEVVLTELAKPVPPGMLAYVKGTQVIMKPRRPRGKSKRIGCHIRKPNEAGGRRRMNRAGGSRKMTKAEVARSFAGDIADRIHDDVAMRTAWNDYTDALYRSGMISAAVYNSSVPAKFLKRKSNRAGGLRRANRAGRPSSAKSAAKAKLLKAWKNQYKGRARGYEVADAMQAALDVGMTESDIGKVMDQAKRSI